jgi:hypothetical protein
MAMADEMNEKIEYLRLDVSNRAVTAQLSAFKIEFAVARDEDHLCADPRELTCNDA